MKIVTRSLFFIAITASTFGADLAYKKQKERVSQSVEQHRDELIELANQVWGFAEIALKEERSAKVLADYLEAQGFRVSRGVAGMPTAFVAEYGKGKPIVGILGEYDALPGLSQKSVPRKEALQEGAPGHGCGHNLFGAASAGAAVALKDLMAKEGITGTIRFYGTPAEESVGGKIYMIKAGLFRNLDAVLAWHPSTKNEADVQSSQAIVDLKIEFFGKAAHAAFDPWNGRSALDALDLFLHALNLMREHVRPTVRIHYVVRNGGNVPNVVPEYTELWCWIRDSRRDGVESVLQRAHKAAEGAARATETTFKLTIQGGSYEVLPIRAGALLMHENLRWLGPIEYTPEEQQFARELQRNAGVPDYGVESSIAGWRETAEDPEGGSTDVGDVSWVVPVINLSAATAPKGVPWHSWAVVACGAHSIGHKGMTLAAKGLAATAVDLLLNAENLQRIQNEFAQKTKGQTYKSFVEADSPN